MAVDDEPAEEKTMTSSMTSSSSRPLSWLHLGIIYGLLGVYGLWAATSYQLIRSSLVNELETSMQRRSAVVEEFGLGGNEHIGPVERAAVRRRRSADDIDVNTFLTFYRPIFLNKTTRTLTFFYRAMHHSAKHDCMSMSSVRPSVCQCQTVCTLFVNASTTFNFLIAHQFSTTKTLL